MFGERAILLGLSLVRASEALTAGQIVTPRDFGCASLSNPVVKKTGSEWVMFYTYRPLEGTDEMPPLTTGRVGRATSPDGVRWTAATDGLGAGGSALSENEDDWWFYDTGHVCLGDVYRGDGAWYMYTHGGSTEVASLPNGMEARGMDLKIGVAVSQDGVSFGRFEGQCPDGAILEPADDPLAWDAGAVGWPTIVSRSGDFLLYYQSIKGDVGVAASKDGIIFDRLRADPVLAPSDEGFDSGAVLRRTARLTRGTAIEMVYEARDKTLNRHSFGRASSKDGVTFTKLGQCFQPSEDPQAWDAGSVSAPCVVQLDDAKPDHLRLYYAASAPPSTKGESSSSVGFLFWGGDQPLYHSSHFSGDARRKNSRRGKVAGTSTMVRPSQNG